MHLIYDHIYSEVDRFGKVALFSSAPIALRLGRFLVGSLAGKASKIPMMNDMIEKRLESVLGRKRIVNEQGRYHANASCEIKHLPPR